MEHAAGIYVPTEADRASVEEIRRSPFGPHRPDTLRLLTRLRWEPLLGKLVLICLEPYRRWAIGRVTGLEERPVERIDGRVFEDLADAEWAVFCLRWRALTGEALDPSR